MKGVYKKKSGSVLIFIAIIAVVLMGFTALVIDVGMLVYQRQRLQNACDAAALAGAMQLPDKPTGDDGAIAVAKQYASDNGVTINDTDVTISADNKKITVNASRNLQFTFAKLLGINSGQVSAKATAVVAPVKTVGSGLRPFGVVKKDFVIGNTYTLKYGTFGNNGGDFGAISLYHDKSDDGGKVYEDNIKYGSTESYGEGVKVDIKQGNMVGPTADGIGFLDEAHRTVKVPIVNNNGDGTVTITGFAIFHIDGYGYLQDDGSITVDDKGGKGHFQVTGTFKSMTSGEAGDEGQADYGLRGVKLIE